MKYFIKQFILLTLVVLGINLKAQQYPVQTIVQVNTPHTLSMSDYHSSSFEKLKVTLINTDFQKPSINVIMRMSITGPNQSIKTKAYILEANPPVFTLNYGTPLVISSVTNSTEMNWFFNPDNLDFTGITKSQYIANGQKLEEGLYQFCFEVYEETTNNLVSGKRCTMAWLALLDPPLLNLPLEAANLPNTPGFQSINFTWTPRHLSNPQMAFNTEYDFQIREINDTMATAASVFANNNTNLYEITQSQTYLNLSNTYPLTAGMRYAWRVKAKFTQGSYEAIAFNNDGYSEARWFKFQNGCPRVDTVNATKINPHQVKLTWNQNSNHTDFKVKYKEQGTTQWYDISCKQSPAYMTNLKPKTTYIFKLGSTCIFGEGFDDQNSNWSDEFSVTTDSMNVENEPNCGIIEPATSIANQTPITTLYQNDVIFAGKYFPVFITSISGSGTFSGEGYIGIPAYAKAQLKVRFVNIKVNTDKQLISGYIETTFDPDMNGLFNGTQFVDGGSGVGSVKTGTSSAEIYTTFPITNISQITYTVVDGKVVVTISTSTGTKTVTIDKLPISIQDSNGKIYGIAKDGSKYVIGQTGIALRQTRKQLDSLSTDKGSAIFLDYPEKQYYAFDKYESIYSKSLQFRDCYQVIPKNGGASAYRVASKLTVAAKPDFVKVTVTLTGSGMIQDSVKFITSRGTQFEKTLISGTTYEVKIVGGPESDAQEVFAMYPADSGRYYTLGKLLVPSYKQQNRKVVLVPVGSVSMAGVKDSITNSLARAYSPLGIDWEVVQDTVFTSDYWDQNADGKLNFKGSSGKETEEMTAMKEIYSGTKNIESGTAYLFIVNESDSNIAGDMPRGKQFGYLFKSVAGNTIGKVAIHELGHGLQLRHIFDENEFGGSVYGFDLNDLPENSMDYSLGIKFTKLQWDQLHSPGFVIGLLENSNDQKLYYTEDGHWAKLPLNLANKDGTYTCLTASGKLIVLPKNTLISFQDIYSEVNRSENARLLTGVLWSFKINNNQYRAFYDFPNNKLIGYFCNGVKFGDSTYQLNLTANHSCDSFILPIYNNEGITYCLFRKGSNQLKYSFTDENIINESTSNLSLFNNVNSFVTKYNSGKISGDIQSSKAVVKFCDDFLEFYGNNEYPQGKTYLCVEKLALLAVEYPTLFRNFTTDFNYLKWQRDESFKVTVGGSSSITVFGGIWDKKVIDFTSNGLKAKWQAKNYEAFFLEMLNDFESYIATKNSEKANFWVNFSSSTTREELLENLYIMSDYEIEHNINLNHRKDAIKLITTECIHNSGSSPDNLELAVTKLVISTPADDKNEILDFLAGTHANTNNTLLSFLSKDDCGLDGDEWQLFATKISEWIVAYKTRTYSNIISNYENGRVLRFDQDAYLYVLGKIGNFVGLVQYPSSNKLTEDFTSTGEKIKLISAKTGYTTTEVEVNPYEYVNITCDKEVVLNGITYSKNQPVFIPAFLAYYFFNETNRTRMLAATKTSIDIATFALGFGEVNAAIEAAEAANTAVNVFKTVKFYKAMGDLVVPTGDAAFQALGEKYGNDPKFKQVAYYWNKFSMLYGTSRLTYEGGKALLTIRSNWVQARNELIDKIEADVVNNTITRTEADAMEEGLKKEGDVMEDGVNKALNEVEGSLAKLNKKLAAHSELRVWVNDFDEIADAKLISYLEDLEADFLTKLEVDITSSSGTEVKNLLRESPDDLILIWKKLKVDPKYSFELAKTGGSRWEKWAQGNFFKTITKAGKDFEQYVSNNLTVLRAKLLSKFPNIDLNNYAIFEQVQVKTGQLVNGVDEFFVADFVLVKKETVLGQEILDFDNVIVLETKLSSSTALTTPQTNALAKATTTSNTFDIRSINKSSTTNNNFSLGSGTDNKTVKVVDFIKVNSDGIGNTIQDVTSLK